MLFMKIGMRTWEKETHPIPGPEITSKTLVVVKMIDAIDKGLAGKTSILNTIKNLLKLNCSLNCKKKVSKSKK